MRLTEKDAKRLSYLLIVRATLNRAINAMHLLDHGTLVDDLTDVRDRFDGAEEGEEIAALKTKRGDKT